MCRCIILILIFLKISSPEYSLTYKPGLIKVNINYYTTVKSCEYFDTEPGDLPLADSEGFFFPENSIFFTETTCRGGLNFRQACAVESAARAHPNRQVNVLFASAVTEKKLRKRPLSALLMYPNIRLYRIRLNRFGLRTPAENLIKHQLVLSSFFINHAADVIKVLTLHKYGGIFLDLDVIVLKSFDTLPHSNSNFIGREDFETFSLGVVAYSNDALGRKFADTTLEILRRDFNPNGWRINSIECFRKTMVEIYKTNILDVFSDNDGNIVIEDEIGYEFAVYQTSYFYPIPVQQYKRYFEPGGILLEQDEVYMVHMWNHLSKFSNIAENSIYIKLAKEFCPETLKLYRFKDIENKKAKKLLKARKQFVDTTGMPDGVNLTGPLVKSRRNWEEKKKENEELLTRKRMPIKFNLTDQPIKSRRNWERKKIKNAEQLTSSPPPSVKIKRNWKENRTEKNKRIMLTQRETFVKPPKKQNYFNLTDQPLNNGTKFETNKKKNKELVMSSTSSSFKNKRNGKEKRKEKINQVTSPDPPVHRLYKILLNKGGFLGPLGACSDVDKLIPAYLDENDNKNY